MTQYFEDKPFEKACGMLIKAAGESIRLIENGKYKRAELVLQCALEDTDELLFGSPLKKDGRQ